jgi:hypothetical protein
VQVCFGKLTTLGLLLNVFGFSDEDNEEEDEDEVEESEDEEQPMSILHLLDEQQQRYDY